MNRAARLEQVVFSHVRDTLVLHTINNNILIKVPLYKETGIILQSVGVHKNELIIEGKLSAVVLKNYCNVPLENEPDTLA